MNSYVETCSKCQERGFNKTAFFIRRSLATDIPERNVCFSFSCPSPSALRSFFSGLFYERSRRMSWLIEAAWLGLILSPSLVFVFLVFSLTIFKAARARGACEVGDRL